MVSFLLPKRLHQDFYNVYAYCRWADDLGDEIGDRAESLRLLAWWRQRTGSHVCGQTPRIRYSWRSQGTVHQYRFPQPAVRRSDPRLRAGSDGDALPDLGRAVRLLPLFRQSGGPAGAVSLRLLRCGTPAPVRRHLHRSATRQFLAGRDGRFREGSRLYPARCAGDATGIRVEDLAARKFNAAFRAAMRELWTKRANCFTKGCRSSKWWTGGWPSIWTCSAGAACACWTRSSSRITTCWPPRPAISKVERAGLLLRSLAHIAFARA